MAKNENLLFLHEMNKSAVTRLIGDISDEESLFRGKDNLQHIRWQTGHIVYNAYIILHSLGTAVELPDSWTTLFRRGCGFAEDSNAYPSMEELRAKFGEYYDLIEKRLGEVSDDDLDSPLASEPIMDTSAMNNVLFFFEHEFYHAGQIAVLRRLLGRERSFG